MPNPEGWISKASSVEELQQALKLMQQERDLARLAEKNWRQRFEVEAQQRRAEAAIAEQTIAHLKAQLGSTQTDQPQTVTAQSPALPPASVSPQTFLELQTKLIQMEQACEQLRQLLEIEKVNHAKTRSSLTTTLCDAVDALNLKLDR